MLRSKKGATLFEMVVVMAIIGIIAILVLAAYRTAQKNYALSGASQRLVADFRQAQGMAIAGAEVAGYSPQGYGIYIQNANSYLLFINTNSSRVYGAGSVLIKTVKLPSLVTVDQLTSSVYFVPPSATPFINNGTQDTISYTLSGATGTKTVTVNKYGKIDLQ